MVAAIQTFGELLHFHPPIHALLTCGAFTAEGEFLELPELDLDRLQTAWQEAVFALYLAEDKIEPEVVQNRRTWPHSGFSVDQSVHLPAGDRAGIERLVQYMTRCPFSLSRLVKATQSDDRAGWLTSERLAVSRRARPPPAETTHRSSSVTKAMVSPQMLGWRR